MDVIRTFLLVVCKDTVTTGIFTDLHALSLHDALPISEILDRAVLSEPGKPLQKERWAGAVDVAGGQMLRSEEHTSELQSLMRISYAVFCLKKKRTPY